MSDRTGASDRAPRFQILCVCVGNVCRSPLMERLLAARLGVGFEVGSAGVRALAGAPMDETVATIVRELGADPGGFRARQLEPEAVRRADLVLVATRDLRSLVLAESPTALRRTFTVREVGALLGEGTRAAGIVASTRSRAEAVAALAACRMEVARADLDVPDPYRQAPAVHRSTAALVEPAIARLATVLKSRR